MSKNIGFIGCGNMGTAMMQGIIDSGKCSPQEIMISCRTQATVRGTDYNGQPQGSGICRCFICGS